MRIAVEERWQFLNFLTILLRWGIFLAFVGFYDKSYTEPRLVKLERKRTYGENHGHEIRNREQNPILCMGDLLP